MIKIPIQADVDEAGKKIEEFAKKSRTALNSLSLVAQDLPFGFIGIQNNLPNVISSFGELTRDAGGLGGALKQLGSSLIGPAGLFFAFSAVTAGVTFLIQKYGSLSAGIAALISNNAKLIEVQNSLNKELATTVGGTAAETAKIQILVKSINDLSKPMKERQDAYVALKKIAPEIARGIGEENTLTQKNIDLINENSKARIEYIKLRARENAINSIINKNEIERISLEQQFPALLAKKQKAESAYNKVKGISFDGTKTFNAGLQTEAINLESATNALDKNALQRRELFKINDGLIKQLTPLIDGTSKYDAATKEFTNSLKKQKEVKSIPQVGIGGPGTLVDTAAAFAAYVKGNINIQKASIDKILRDRTTYKRKEIEQGIGVPKKIDKIAAAPLSKELEDLLGRFQLFQAGLAENLILLNQTFFQPLESAFMTLFETGKFGFKDFADAVLKQIQQLVSKIIATGIISLIGNLLAPGVGTVGGGGAGILSRVGESILRSIGLGGPGVANPSFGGVGPGSLGMSGQVNVVLRGSDLVGALNRTNATINRVG
jgi:regulator of replication initiation timing